MGCTLQVAATSELYDRSMVFCIRISSASSTVEGSTAQLEPIDGRPIYDHNSYYVVERNAGNYDTKCLPVVLLILLTTN